MFTETWLSAIPVMVVPCVIVWLISIPIKNVSIVDIFWGLGFVITAAWFRHQLPAGSRADLIFILVTVWGCRLSFYLGYRNIGKPEDYRYQQFRERYGRERYWWFSFFQVFLLQGVLIWIIATTLLGGMMGPSSLGVWEYAGLTVWAIGFFFETVGDYQLARFKSNPSHAGQVMDRGLWRYTRHPNYFGDAMVWWGFALFSIGAGHYVPIAGSLLMTFLLLKVSGVALLEKQLKTRRPGYESYIRRTSAFFPWFPLHLKE